MLDARRHQSHHTLLLREPQHLGEVNYSVWRQPHLLFPEAGTDQGEKGSFNLIVHLLHTILNPLGILHKLRIFWIHHKDMINLSEKVMFVVLRSLYPFR